MILGGQQMLRKSQKHLADTDYVPQTDKDKTVVDIQRIYPD